MAVVQVPQQSFYHNTAWHSYIAKEVILKGGRTYNPFICVKKTCESSLLGISRTYSLQKTLYNFRRHIYSMESEVCICGKNASVCLSVCLSFFLLHWCCVCVHSLILIGTTYIVCRNATSFQTFPHTNDRCQCHLTSTSSFSVIIIHFELSCISPCDSRGYWNTE